MKVLSVSNYQKYYSGVPCVKQNSQNKNVSFKGWELNMLNRSEAEVQKIAKAFCRASDDELRDVTSEYIGAFIKKKNKSLAGYYRLKPAVDKVKAELKKIENSLLFLENKTYKTTKDEKEIQSLKDKVAEYDHAYERRWDYYEDPNEDSYGAGDIPSPYPFDFP